MSRHIARRFSSLAIRLAAGVLSCTVSWHAVAAFGQTALGDQIRAEARYIDACARMRLAASEARRIDAEAFALEIDNSVAYVKAYYDRRHLYEAEWRRRNPDAITLENQRQANLKLRAEKHYQAVMRGSDRGVTDMSNWLLRELSNSVVSYQYLFAGKSALQPETDLKLTDRDLQLIRLTDGGREGSRLVFAAGDGKVLLPKWPLALRGHECDAARDNYERARDAVVKEIQTTGKISYEAQTELMQAVNGLYAALKAAYPKEKLNDQREFLVYAAGKRYVQTLVAAAHRAITINDASVFSSQLRFQGNSLFGLIQHMHRNGLEFAPPEPGGEGNYRTLFENLRTMYINIGREQPAADAQQRNANDANQAPKKQDEPKKDRDV